jgi:BirA family biotin operon repressor/biotin-[acetyl-CoA-carboxylase] ligase
LQLPSAVNPIGSPFIELQSVDSTNKYAMTMAHEGMALHGTAIFTQEQTEGKGQRGKKWNSENGSNIVLSLFINPYPFSLNEQFKLSICTAVSVHEFFSQYAGNETKIKWPNDLYWRDRKAGGVLIENVVGRSKELGVGNRQPAMGNWQWAIIGIGININQTSFSKNLPNPVSLKQITGKNFEPVTMAKEFCAIFDKYFQILVAGKFEQLFNLYQTHLYKKDEKVKLKKDNRVFETTIKGVAETGQLITQHAFEEKFEFGEVEWVR